MPMGAGLHALHPMLREQGRQFLDQLVSLWGEEMP